MNSNSEKETKGERDELGRFVPGWTGGPGRPKGRVAGFQHFTAEVFAHMLDSRVDESGKSMVLEDGKPDPRGKAFPIYAAEKYMARINLGGYPLQEFMDRVLPNLSDLDRLLTNQKSQDLKYLRYLIYCYCFDEQQAVLMTKKPVVTVICGRRAGKSTLFGGLLVDRSITREKGIALYLGRTAKSAFDMIWRPTIDILDYIGLPFVPHIATQTIELNNGTRIMVKGRDSKADMENIRGLPIYLAVIDETQGDPPDKLKMLVREILEPAGKDFEGSQVIMGGTPSRIPGNYAEEVYSSNRDDVARFNWNMSVNPHLPKRERNVETTRIEKGFSETDPTFLREYKGVVGSYDTEALVLRFQPVNHFRDTDLTPWIDSQPITDIFLSGFVDYGFEDYDSAGIIMASESKGERFVLCEYKGHRQSTSDFGNNLKLLIAKVMENPLLKAVNKRFAFYCDTEGLGKQLTFDMAAMFGLSVQPAYQGEKDLMFEMLQDDVKAGRLKVREKQTVGGVEIVSEIEQESYKIVFARDEQDHLTRRIDDEVFHPEIVRGLTYGMRYVWLKSKVKPGGGS